jgi:hypothetical protein
MARPLQMREAPLRRPRMGGQQITAINPTGEEITIPNGGHGIFSSFVPIQPIELT